MSMEVWQRDRWIRECQREVESIGEVKKLQARVSMEGVGTRMGGGWTSRMLPMF